MRDVRLMHDVCNDKGALRRTATVSASRSHLKHNYVMHNYRMNTHLKIRKRNSVIVVVEKLLITLKH